MTKEIAVKKKRSLKIFRATYVVLICVLLLLIFIAGHIRNSYLYWGIYQSAAQQLHKANGKVTSDDLKKIESITIYYDACPDLKRLKILPNLKELSLINIYSAAKSPPVWIVMLRGIFKMNNKKKFEPFDLKPLKKFNKLESLTIHSPKFDNIKTFAELKHLKSISLQSIGGTINDISPLLSLENLQSLCIETIKDNQINSISNLTNLQELYIVPESSATEIDLSFVTNLKKLRKLIFDSGIIKDITPVSELTELQYLDIQVQGYSDISSLAELKNLEHLYLSSADINDISPLSGLTNLKELYVNSIKVNDITPLSQLKNLEYLFTNGLKTDDLSPITKLGKLKHLSFFNAEMSDIEPLGKLIDLEYILFSSTNIKDITPLKGLINLQKLELENCENITDQQIGDLQKALPKLKIYR